MQKSLIVFNNFTCIIYIEDKNDVELYKVQMVDSGSELFPLYLPIIGFEVND